MAKEGDYSPNVGLRTILWMLVVKWRECVECVYDHVTGGMRGGDASLIEERCSLHSQQLMTSSRVVLRKMHVWEYVSRFSQFFQYFFLQRLLPLAKIHRSTGMGKERNLRIVGRCFLEYFIIEMYNENSKGGRASVLTNKITMKSTSAMICLLFTKSYVCTQIYIF